MCQRTQSQHQLVQQSLSLSFYNEQSLITLGFNKWIGILLSLSNQLINVSFLIFSSRNLFKPKKIFNPDQKSWSVDLPINPPLPLLLPTRPACPWSALPNLLNLPTCPICPFDILQQRQRRDDRRQPRRRLHPLPPPLPHLLHLQALLRLTQRRSQRWASFLDLHIININNNIKS